MKVRIAYTVMVMTGIISLCSLAVTPLVTATEYYVDQTFGDDLNDGLGWATAKATIQAALSLVSGADTINVAEGYYYERLTLSTAGLTMIGGYPAGGGERDPEVYVTGLDGSLAGVTLTIGSVLDIEVDGFLIRKGTAASGGGLSASGATNLRIVNCTIQENSATTSGGAIYLASTTATFEYTKVQSNSCSGANAGAMMIVGSTVDLNYCQFLSNAISAGSSYGGALYIDAASVVTVLGSEFTSNSCYSTGSANTYAAGGAIYCVGTLNLTNSELTSNLARSTYTGGYSGYLNKYAYGGAVCLGTNGIMVGIGNTYSNNVAYVDTRNANSSQRAYGYAYGGAIQIGGTTSLTLSYETISSNTCFCYAQDTANYAYAYAYGHGGGIMTSDTAVVNLGLGIMITSNVVQVSAAGNSGTGAYSYGGGISVNGAAATVDIDGVSIGRNTLSASPANARAGAGLYIGSTSLDLYNSMIYRNNTDGVYVNGGSPRIINNTLAYNSQTGINVGAGTPTVRNCILWGNTDDLAGGTATFSNIQNNDPGEGNLDPPCDPLFVGGDDFHILPTSCCIDRGSMDEILSHDIDNEFRPYNFGTVDIGADEVAAIIPTATPYLPPVGTPTMVPEPINDFYVDGQTGNDANDGLSWGTAKASISAAIDLVETSGEGFVHVATWTYEENVVFVHNLHLLGGYPHGGGTREPDVFLTIIDGRSLAPAVRIGGVNNAVLDGFLIKNGTGDYGGGVHVGRSLNVRILNNTVTLNQTLTSPSLRNLSLGGGIYVEGTNIEVSNNEITNNVAAGSEGQGGGLFCAPGYNIVVTNNIINNNTAGFAGGGLAVSSPHNVEVNGCTINGNLCNGTGGGGGVYVTATGNATIANGIISSNTATRSQAALAVVMGGGIYTLGRLNLTNNTIETNFAYAYYNSGYGGNLTETAQGGAMYCGNGSIVVSTSNNYLTNDAYGYAVNVNSSQRGYGYGYGGAICCTAGSNVQLFYDVLRSNRARSYGQDTANYAYGYSYAYGGGVFCADSSTVVLGQGTIIESNTVSASAAGNSGYGAYSYGGGVSVHGASSNVLFDGATINRNSLSASPATTRAGYGVYIDASPAQIHNSVIAENAGTGLYINASATKVITSTIAYNASQGIYNTGGTPIITSCILWGNYTDLEGATATYSDIQGGNPGTGNLDPPCDPLFAGNSDYHLLPGSCCIDRGSYSFILPHDFDGEPRPWNAGIPDIGMDEVSRANPTPTPYATPAGTPSPIPSPSQNYYVDAINGDNGNDGLSWATAKATITAAIFLAEGSGGGNVHVAGYAYQENIVCVGNLYLLGGYPPGGGPRDPGVYPTVLNGGYRDPTVSIIGINNVVLDGFIVLNGRGDYGGGISVGHASHVRITNNVITTNECNSNPARNYAKGGGVYLDGVDIVLDNNEISNNVVNGDGGYGGGVYVAVGPSITISNNIISANSAGYAGGGIAVSNPDQALFANNTIENNYCSGVAGGAIHLNATGNAIFNGNRIANNLMKRNQIANATSVGGAIACEGTLILIDNEFIDNENQAVYSGGYGATLYEYAYGGALYCGTGSNVQSIGNTYYSNRTYAYGVNVNSSQQGRGYGYGGAIYCTSGSSVIISGDTIEANTAYAYGQDTANYSYGYAYAYGGGIYCADGATTTIGDMTYIKNNNCDASAAGNSGSGAYAYGGGILLTGADSTIVIDGAYISSNSLASSPASGRTGHGIYASSGTHFTIYNSFIVDNPGVGIYLNAATIDIINNTIANNTSIGIYAESSVPTVRNCILWGNADDLNGATATYSNIMGGDSGIGNLDPPCNPMFVGSGDYHLRPGSCCVDRGQNSLAPLTDFDGETRPYSIRIVDIGADEVPYNNPTPDPSYVPSTPTPVGSTTPTPSANYYVDKTNGDDGNDGLSWATAKQSIGNAVSIAGPGACIHVARATYYENLELPSSLVLLGGYPVGGGTRNPDLDITVIDGLSQNTVLMMMGKHDITIDGFTLMHGYQSSGAGIFCYDCEHVAFINCSFEVNTAGSIGSGVKGGGAFIGNSYDVWFDDCTFIENLAQATVSSYGGGMHIEGSALVTVSGCLFLNNQSSFNAGAISCMNVDDSVLITSSTFTNNQATNGYSTSVTTGGAIYCNGTAAPEISNNTFSTNWSYGTGVNSESYGGALFLEGASVVSGNTFEANQARTYFSGGYGGYAYAYGYGGAVFISGSSASVTLESNYFLNNWAYAYSYNTNSSQRGYAHARGGAVYCNSSTTATISHCTIMSNTAYSYGRDTANYGYGYAYSYGGAIFLSTGVTTTINEQTLIKGNVATATASGNSGSGGYAYAGGVFISDAVAAVTIDRTIIDANDAVASPATTVQGDGIYINSNNPITLTNTFITNNGGYGIYCATGGPNIKIANITMANNGSYGIYRNAGTLTIINGILWNNGDDLYNVTATYSDIQDGDTGTGNLAVVPGFASTTDFHITHTSPCKDTGLNVADPPTVAVDYDGNVRPQDTTFDMGADEFAGYPVFNLTTFLNGFYNAGTQVATTVDIEFRSGSTAATATTLVASYPDVPVNTSGSTGDIVLTGCPGGDFYVVVKHLNHLSVITASRVTLNYESTAILHLGNPASPYYVECYGTVPLHTETDAKLSQRGGNANSDGYINAAGDFVLWLAANGSIPSDPNWDEGADFNGNLAVNSADYSVWLAQNGSISYVPTAARSAYNRGIGVRETGLLRARFIGWGLGDAKTLDVEVLAASDRETRILALDAALAFDPEFLAEPELIADYATEGVTDFSLGVEARDLPNSYHFCRGALPGQKGLKLERGETVLYRLRFQVLKTWQEEKPVIGFVPGFSEAVTSELVISKLTTLQESPTDAALEHQLDETIR